MNNYDHVPLRFVNQTKTFLKMNQNRVFIVLALTLTVVKYLYYFYIFEKYTFFLYELPK